jgi:AhpD family alkylhydroperoxidase
MVVPQFPGDRARLRKVKDMSTRKQYVIDLEYDEVLGAKIRRLIRAGCAVVADCPTCLRNGVASAKEAGATPAEIREALQVGIMVSAGRARNFVLEFVEELGIK